MQNTAIRNTGAQWLFLEPVMNPSFARTIHGVLKSAGAGLYVTYPQGQWLVQKNDFTNEWAKVGTSGYGGAGTARPRLLKYPVIVNDAGVWQLGDTWFSVGNEFHEGSVDMYYKGYFKLSEITGNIGGGTNAVQIATEGAGINGGTFTIEVTDPVSGVSQTTAALAYNASAATIQAALEALPNVETNDIIVSGSAAGPYTFTFSGGHYAGRPVPLLEIQAFNLSISGVFGGATFTVADSVVGASGGKNEVQTETVTATGGTRTLTITNPNTGEAQTTGALAYNASAATIQAALEGLSNVAVGDVAVTGTGPYVYTFGGQYAGHNVAAIAIGVGSLTGGSSTMADTTVGVEDFSQLGTIIQTAPIGIIELGAAAPA